MVVAWGFVGTALICMEGLRLLLRMPPRRAQRHRRNCPDLYGGIATHRALRLSLASCCCVGTALICMEGLRLTRRALKMLSGVLVGTALICMEGLRLLLGTSFVLCAAVSELP